MSYSCVPDVRRMANEYRNLVVKANTLRIRNDNTPTREEAECYKRAAELTEKLANLSIGTEYEYWIERQEEVSRKFDEISDYFLKGTEESNSDYDYPAPKAAAKSSKPAAVGEGGSDKKASKGKKKNDYQVPQEVVDRWFKDPPKHGFEAVAGMEDIIEKLKNCVKNIASTKLNSFMEMDTVFSFFFYGPPGCGKTFISQAFANELMKQGYSYMSLSGGDIHNALVGESEKYVERAFREAQEKAPCIMFIDEIDSVCRNRSLPNIPSHAMSTTTAFLTGYNEIYDSGKPIIFIGATNYPNLVDNPMLDRVEMVQLPLPDVTVRENTFKKIFGKFLKTEDGFSFKDMAELTYNYNQRDIKRLCGIIKQSVKEEVLNLYSDDEASVNAMQNGDYRLKKECFMKALKSYKPSKKDDIIRSLDAWDWDRAQHADE